MDFQKCKIFQLLIWGGHFPLQTPPVHASANDAASPRRRSQGVEAISLPIFYLGDGQYKYPPNVDTCLTPEHGLFVDIILTFVYFIYEILKFSALRATIMNLNSILVKCQQFLHHSFGMFGKRLVILGHLTFNRPTHMICIMSTITSEIYG